MIELDAISEFVKCQGVGISTWHEYDHDSVWADLSSGPVLWRPLGYGLIIQGGTINMYRDDSVQGNITLIGDDYPYIVFRAHLSAPDCLGRLGIMLEAMK